MRLVIILLISTLVWGCRQEKVIDDALAKNAEVILRVDCAAEADTCDKYCWQNVAVLKVLKNKSGFKFHKVLQVAHYNWEAGIPIGVSTLYLEKYNPSRNDVWRLVEGSAASGVSHFAQPRRQAVVTERRPQGRHIINTTGEDPNTPDGI